MKHAYCTYFDHNYLPRAILALRSLRTFDAESTVYVLALSDLCRDVLAQLALPNVEVITLSALETAFEELKTLKPKRSAIEYIFTITPFWPLHLFETTSVDLLTYIDADLYFFSSPLPLLKSIEQSSVAITPHRFSKHFSRCEIYGHFNVGWMTFRRCAEGLKCLQDYKADCAAWCHDWVEDGRFADQGYLNSWPQRYPSLRIIEDKGVNLALWNADNYVFEERGETVLVDGESIVFYHFHGLKLQPDGSFEANLPPRHSDHESVLYRRVVKPYLDDLGAARTDLHQRFPTLAPAESDLRYGAAGRPSELSPGSFDEAVYLHRKGHFSEAEALYLALLRTDSTSFGVLHRLGILRLQQGRAIEAIESIGAALEQNPQSPQAHTNLAVALETAGRRAEAVQHFEAAVALDSMNSEWHFNLGNAHAGLGQFGESVAHYEAALNLTPDYFEAHVNVAVALKALGRISEAIAHYRTALALKPNYAELHNDVGSFLSTLDRHSEAVELFERAIALRPDYAEANFNLGNAFSALRQIEEAIRRYERAIALKPNFAAAQNNLANLLSLHGRFAEAEAYLRRSLDAQPDNARWHYNHGIVLDRAKELDAARRAFMRSIELEPGYVDAHRALGTVLLQQGQLSEAGECYRRAVALDPASVDANANLLFALNHDAGLTAEQVFHAHRAYGVRREASEPRGREKLANRPDAERRLRIGYVSPDFREHSCAYFLEPLLAAHDRARFEIYGYAEMEAEDDVTARLKSHCDHWRSTLGKSDDEVERMIRADGIDILVDLAGLTNGNRLAVFGRKPAPLAVTWLGYPNTTGLAAIDYRLTDAIADPPGISDGLATERLLRVPNFLCYQPLERAPGVVKPPHHATGHVTFGSFNNIAKINDVVVATWSTILERVPGSRLLLKSGALRDEATRDIVARRFAEQGIAPDRVETLAPLVDTAEHLALYGRVDIALDTFPYNGTTTTCEALWMGVPVVTLRGDRHAARVGASLLTAAGLATWIAETRDGYIAHAVEAAGARASLGALRAGIRPMLASSRLCDRRGFALGVEAAFRDIWRRWCASATV